MKMNWTLSLLTLLMAFSLQAQIKTPAPSPLCKMTQTVGLTDVTVEYSRPSLKGRTVFAADGLVPFGEMWRTGANKNTMITFTDDVVIGGRPLTKGTYAIFVKPMAGEWTVYFYTDTENWGTPEKWDTGKIAAEVNVKTTSTNQTVESFLIQIDHIEMDNAHLQIMWENTMVAIPFKVPVDEKVQADIKKALAGPTARDYYSAASYIHDTKGDLTTALTYIQKANTMDAKFWQLRRESLILADMDRYPEALAKAEMSKTMAQEAGNTDYVRMNDKSIAEWNSKMKNPSPKKMKMDSKGAVKE